MMYKLPKPALTDNETKVETAPIKGILVSDDTDLATIAWARETVEDADVALVGADGVDYRAANLGQLNVGTEITRKHRAH